jgi:hypothetical protein
LNQFPWQRLLRAAGWTLFSLVLWIWLYHVALGGASLLVGVIWTVGIFVPVMSLGVAFAVLYNRYRRR